MDQIAKNCRYNIFPVQSYIWNNPSQIELVKNKSRISETGKTFYALFLGKSKTTFYCVEMMLRRRLSRNWRSGCPALPFYLTRYETCLIFDTVMLT